MDQWGQEGGQHGHTTVNLCVGVGLIISAGMENFYLKKGQNHGIAVESKLTRA